MVQNVQANETAEKVLQQIVARHLQSLRYRTTISILDKSDFGRNESRHLVVRLSPTDLSRIDAAGGLSAVGLAVAACGWLLGTLWPLEQWTARALLWRFFWAFIQQYALQAFVFVRLREVYDEPHLASLAAAGVFAFLHLPNPLLTVFTFLSGYLWCRLFARQPNLFTLALSHTILALVTSHSFPRAWMHSMKVGPGYFNF